MSDEILLSAVGDMLLADQYLTIGRGTGASVRRKGVRFLLDGVRESLRASDLVFGNLEAPLARPLRLNWERNTFRGTPEAAEALAEAGFRVVSMANNHLMEHGPEPALETRQYLHRAGIAWVGMGEEPEMAHRPVILSIKNQQIGFLSYTFVPVTQNGLLYPVPTCASVLADVARARPQVDFLVLSLHWGAEYAARPSAQQVAFAHDLIDAGVDVVIGHHPHVLQGMEQYHNGVVFYSLGNFIFDMEWMPALQQSVIAQIYLKKGSAPRVERLPVRIGAASQPRVLEGDELEKELYALAGLDSRVHDACNTANPDEEYAAYVAEKRAELRTAWKRYIQQKPLTLQSSVVTLIRQVRMRIFRRGKRINAVDQAHVWKLND